MTPHACERLRRWESRMSAEPEIAVREPRVCLRKIRLERERTLEMCTRLVHSIRATVQLEASLQVRLVCLDVRRQPRTRCNAPNVFVRHDARSFVERFAQGGSNRIRDLILYREDVGQLAVIMIAPQLIAVIRVHELRADTHTVPGAPHASFEQRAHMQPLSD